MAFDPSHIPKGLLDTIQAGNCVAFVGAGLSIGAGLPGWRELVCTMLDWCRRERVELAADYEIYQNLINDGRLEATAQALREGMGEARFGDFLNQILDSGSARPTDTHLQLVSVAFERIVTTNFDKLIEKAYAKVHEGAILATHTGKDGGALSRLHKLSAPVLMKLHGDVGRPNTVVLGSGEFTRAIYDKKVEGFLSTLLKARTLLFLGCSFDDRHMLGALEKLSNDYEECAPPHYAAIPRDGNEDAWKKDLWSQYKLAVLDYDKSNDHAWLRDFLQYLASADRGRSEAASASGKAVGLVDRPVGCGPASAIGPSYTPVAEQVVGRNQPWEKLGLLILLGLGLGVCFILAMSHGRRFGGEGLVDATNGLSDYSYSAGLKGPSTTSGVSGADSGSVSQPTAKDGSGIERKLLLELDRNSREGNEGGWKWGFDAARLL